ncbi:hypothetical protein LXL04_023966 [Taraxacum kok-saghyz]
MVNLPPIESVLAFQFKSVQLDCTESSGKPQQQARWTTLPLANAWSGRMQRQRPPAAFSTGFRDTTKVVHQIVEGLAVLHNKTKIALRNKRDTAQHSILCYINNSWRFKHGYQQPQYPTPQYPTPQYQYQSPQPQYQTPLPQFQTPSPQFQTPSPLSHTSSPQFEPPSPFTEESTQEVLETQEETSDSEESDEEEVGRGKGKAVTKNWTNREEEVLAEAWCGHSGDARYGNDQNAKQFWKHVTRRFNKILGKGRHYRSFDQCNSKWNKMNHEVQKFNGVYVNYRNQPHSGENDTDILARAETTYQQDTLKKWQFGHVWRVVKDNEKWQQLPLMDEIAKLGKRRNKLSTSHLPNSQDDPYNVDLDDDIPPPPPWNLPMGRDRAKKKAKTSSSESARSSSARSDELSQIRNQFENMTAQLSSRNELRAIQIYMRGSISHLEGEELENAKALNVYLKQKWGDRANR